MSKEYKILNPGRIWISGRFDDGSQLSRGVDSAAGVRCGHMGEKNKDLKLASLAYTLKGCPLFEDLSADELTEIIDFAVLKSVDKGDHIFREGDPSHGFYVVQSGTISVHRINAHGNEQVIHMFRVGESFGEGSLAVPEGYPADAKAVESSQVVLIQKAGFVELLGRKPDLAVRMLAVMSMRLRMLLAQIEDLTVKDVDCRLANWLLRRCPDPESEEAFTIDLSFTKKVLAAELGTVSETLSRTLGHLRDKGLLAVKGKSITVLSPAGLDIFLQARFGG